jgi:hypothetical protein
MAEFQKPHKGDVVRNLSTLTHKARHQAATDIAALQNTFAVGGGGRNARQVAYIAEAVDKAHSAYVEEAMRNLAGFLGQVDASVAEMKEWAKAELENASNMLLVEIKSGYYPDVEKSLRQQYEATFRQRIDHALREFELGRVNGTQIKVEGGATASTAQQPAPAGPAYVSQDRLEALRTIKNSQFDLSKLIRLCEELNSNYSAGNYYSVAMLVRAILDHVPPMFSATKFEGVRAQHGGASFKQQMDHLDQSSRKIADAFLHEHVRRREVLPTDTQVYCAPALDTLLGEVAVKLQLSLPKTLSTR